MGKCCEIYDFFGFERNGIRINVYENDTYDNVNISDDVEWRYDSCGKIVPSKVFKMQILQ